MATIMIIMITNVLLSLSFFLCPSPTKSQTLTDTTINNPSPAPSVPPSPSNKLIEHACKRCYVRSFCVETLESDLVASKASNNLALAQATLNLMIRNATDAQNYIAEYLKDKRPPLKASLKKCVSWYSLVIGSFKSSYNELVEDPETANYDVFVSADWIDDCVNELESKGFSISSISARNKLIRKFIFVGYTITSVLWVEGPSTSSPSPSPSPLPSPH